MVRPPDQKVSFTYSHLVDERTRVFLKKYPVREVVMTLEVVKELLREWAEAKGGSFTDEDLASLVAVLEERFLSPETATLEQAREAIGLA